MPTSASRVTRSGARSATSMATMPPSDSPPSANDGRSGGEHAIGHRRDRPLADEIQCFDAAQRRQGVALAPPESRVGEHRGQQHQRLAQLRAIG